MGFFDWVSDTAASIGGGLRQLGGDIVDRVGELGSVVAREAGEFGSGLLGGFGAGIAGQPETIPTDRKSTRLNSSH